MNDETATASADPAPFLERHAGTLSDGREIIYFDERSGIFHPADLRELPVQAASSTIRYDPVLDEWVTIASHRQDRTYLPRDEDCPLCPSHGDRHTEVPSPDYDVVVFENRFPSFDTGSEPQVEDAAASFFLERPGLGRCEVVCFTSDHDTAFSALPPSRVRTILETWIDRTTQLNATPGVEQVFCFENRGEEIGITLSHAHGQIYAYPFVPPRMQRMLQSAREHRDRTGRSLFADVLAAENDSGDRVVMRGDHWTAFVPFTARWPLEVHLFPNRHVERLPELDDDERAEFAHIYPELLRALERAWGLRLPYIAAWQQAPTNIEQGVAYLHLQISSIRRAPGKLKYLAGSESAMGAFINDLRPEDTAQRVREALA
ncbi:MAG: UDPglucose--hexose-phosphate uridylyltransferase [Actinomycetota bacterium]|nr:UDPglucose--hexose-phosphate uridylyltransferase [Actinomycetota bacterium]